MSLSLFFHGVSIHVRSLFGIFLSGRRHLHQQTPGFPSSSSSSSCASSQGLHNPSTTGSKTMERRHVWHGFFHFKESETLDVVVLNYRLNTRLLSLALGRAHRVVCADGGANRLRQLFPSVTPSCVIGDFDSITGRVMADYCNRGVEVRLADSEEASDMEKAIDFLSEGGAEHGVDKRRPVLLFGSLGGRLDHELAQISVLHRKDLLSKPIYLIGEFSGCCVLEGGDDIIHSIQPNPLIESGEIGFIPVGGRCDSVSTTGFLYNLHQEPLEVGKRISSSNGYKSMSEPATIECSCPLTYVTSFTHEYQEKCYGFNQSDEVDGFSR
eukprot:TRINITY_DN306_c0_g1_i1.p1 TRINITY_DN306_c0_g1~~TRINITY_DN306_c0_g1_i1.p1  ORF type:complete len:325 (-),score=82.91 TRINITY_DN306_c0_g1_i1:56-1030(-)